jgi:hypothetical protein
MPGTLNSSRMEPADQEAAPVTDSQRQRAARFEREVLPHLDRVYCAALCLAGDQAEASELVQETFARAYAAFGQMPPETDMTARLYRILISTHVGSRRNRREPWPAPALGTRSRAGPADREGASPAAAGSGRHGCPAAAPTGLPAGGVPGRCGGLGLPGNRRHHDGPGRDRDLAAAPRPPPAARASSRTLAMNPGHEEGR